MRTTLEMPIEMLVDSFEIDESCPSGLRRKIMPRKYFKNNVAWRFANNHYGGKPAGCLKQLKTKHPRWMVRFNGKDWQATRIIWAVAHGIDPVENYIDHIDGNSQNNKLSNLRLVNISQSHANRSAMTGNPSGYAGVNKQGNKWKARLRVEGKEINLGTFDELSEAIEARRNGELKYYGEFSFFASRGV